MEADNASPTSEWYVRDAKARGGMGSPSEAIFPLTPSESISLPYHPPELLLTPLLFYSGVSALSSFARTTSSPRQRAR